jgi:hypothetical protein
MTTTISLPTRDCIVIGCDSLATSSQVVVNPFKLLQAFFSDDGKLRVDDNGSPVLDNAQKLVAFTEPIPVNQLPNVTKIFSLEPFKAGLLFAGIAGIGAKSVRTLVETFLEDSKDSIDPNSSIETVGNALLEYLHQEFEVNFRETAVEYRPEMEILLSGYSNGSRTPEIFRLRIGPCKLITRETVEGKYDIVFGGQHDVIQRVVKGIDLETYCNLGRKNEQILNDYHQEVQKWLKEHGCDLEIPEPKSPSVGFQLFAEDFGGVRGIFSDIASLSEQAGINFVEFLVHTMINAQEFSDRIPTVGGQIHVAIITPGKGFKWISKEEFKFQDHSVKRYE